ncbi:alpha-L-rhamnosidase [Spirillospora sp. NBC_00431]
MVQQSSASPPRRRVPRRSAAVLAVSVLGALLVAVSPAHARDACERLPDPAERLSCRTVAERPGHGKYLVSDDDSYARARGVTVEGNASEVANPEGLLEAGGAPAVLTTTARHSATLVVDLGNVMMGAVEVDVRSADRPVRVSYAQFRQFVGPDGDGMGQSFGTDDDPESRVDLFDATRRPVTRVSPGKRETRYVAITLDGPGTVSIDRVRLRKTTYPVTYDGSFHSGDELLNRAWYASAHTGDLATVRQGTSPWMLTVTFDRVLFMGDIHMQGRAGYYQSGDYRMLVRNTLRQFGCVQNPDGSLPLASSPLVTCAPGDPGPPDGWRVPEEGPDPRVALGSAGPLSLYYDAKIDSFTAFWVSALADYYLYSGDRGFVEPLLPVARRAVAFLHGRTDKDGLYYEPKDDTPMRANWQPGDTAYGVDSFNNAAYYDATKGLAYLERHVAGDGAAAGVLEKRAGSVREALNRVMWDPSGGAFVLNADDPRRDRTDDANGGNLFFETVTPERGRKIIDFIDRRLASPYGSRVSEYTDNPYRQGVIHGYTNSMEAIGRMNYGDGAGALRQIRGWWGHMLRNGPGTGWFTSQYDGSVRRGDFANTAWTTALPALSKGLLGVTPTEPGFRRWSVRPQPSGLRWAQGRTPIPGGTIAVRWEHDARGFAMSVDAPARTGGTVSVPLLGENRVIAMDGRVVWDGSRPAPGVHASAADGYVTFHEVAGSHTFAWADGS